MSGLKKRFLQRMGRNERGKPRPGSPESAATASTAGAADSGSDSPSHSNSTAKPKKDKKRRRDRSSSIEEALMSPWRLVFSTGVDSSGCSSGEDGVSLDSLYLHDSPVFNKRSTPLSPLLGKQATPAERQGAVGGSEQPTEEVGIRHRRVTGVIKTSSRALRMRIFYSPLEHHRNHRLTALEAFSVSRFLLSLFVVERLQLDCADGYVFLVLLETQRWRSGFKWVR